ncbi:hypothetical protein KVR01_004083 [Diaporthe batatas]|uniref:uncharacterized protein n=1 Tax=Diaporthe batatas TaxID=748121 RepID=UPI001D040080|nr:uncharacterized protein KVR01_004083 [Diaporthe batatas]KAG8165531.1 hypothetical protein KVR01_004083 [Diaporthe batatas]
MCLTVEYYCICGVVARTEQVQCTSFLARPLPTRFEETHHLRKVAMALPRGEWEARRGVCTQEACPQNNSSAGTVNLAKCPGCSNICYEGACLPDGDDGACSFDELLDEVLQRQIQRELSAITSADDADKSDKSDESSSDFEKELELNLERELTGMEFEFEVDVNKAEFLPRDYWPAYDCTVEFCPFNKESLARANDKLSSMIAEMKREADTPVQWTKDDDDQILDLASHGADDELIAAVMGRQVPDIHDRLTSLRLLKELLK